MKYTERIFQKLLEYYESSYKERLAECPDVKEYFLIIVQQLKKFTKPEVKKQVDDFELKITTAGQVIPILSSEELKSGLHSLNRHSTSIRRSTTGMDQQADHAMQNNAAATADGIRKSATQ